MGGDTEASNGAVGSADEADVLDGGDGADNLRGGEGWDVLLGGADGDVLRGDAGSDTVDGGAGRDHVAYRFDDLGLAAGVMFDGRNIGASADMFQTDGRGGTDRLIDIEQFGLVGTDFGDEVWGSGGDDHVHLRNGSNTFVGGAGRDIVFDNVGGNSDLDGGSGDDRIVVYGHNVANVAGVSHDLIDGGAGFDTVLINWVFQGSAATVSLSGDALSAFTANGNLSASGVSIERIEVWGSGGGDALTGGDADDVLLGFGGVDNVNGGAGDDVLGGGGGADTLNGGTGNDRYRVVVVNNTADNVVNLSGFNVSGAQQVLNDTYGSTDTIISIEGVNVDGGRGDDIITGSAGHDTLNGGFGEDIINAGGGDDIVFQNSVGGIFVAAENEYELEGDDIIDGGSGVDTLLYDFVNRELVVNLAAGTADASGMGHDLVSNFENVIGGLQGDTLTGNDVANRLDGRSGDDTLDGGLGNDVLVGGDGVDSLTGGAGADQAFGDAGNDFLWGGNADDVLEGGDGIDQLWGDAGADTLRGGAGFDVLAGGGGNDAIDGGEGNDLADFSAHGALAIDLRITAAQNTLGGGIDSLVNIEGLIGGGGADSFIGSSRAETFYGGGGDDAVQGGSGSDVLLGEAGADLLRGGNDGDSLDGGLGNDDVRGEAGADHVRGGAGNDQLEGGAGGDIHDGGDGFDIASWKNSTAGVTVDLLNGNHLGDAAGDDFVSIEEYRLSNFADEFLGSAGDDVARGQNGNDVLNGLDGNDALYGGAGGDQLTGEDGNDDLYGNEGGDTLAGEAGNDTILGGAANDQIDGGIGADKLYGEAGNDTLTGGAGADKFIINAGLFGADTVTDFENGVDKIRTTNLTVADDFSDLTVSANGSGWAVVTFPDGSSITLTGVTTAQVDASDFVWG